MSYPPTPRKMSQGTVRSFWVGNIPPSHQHSAPMARGAKRDASKPDLLPRKTFAAIKPPALQQKRRPQPPLTL